MKRNFSVLFSTSKSSNWAIFRSSTVGSGHLRKINILCPPNCSHSRVVTVSLTPIPFRIAALTQERNSLFEYPLERLAEIIKEIGFSCTSCAKCCTREFNGHVFLLDRDVTAIKSIDQVLSNPPLPRSSATRTAYSMFPGMHFGRKTMMKAHAGFSKTGGAVSMTAGLRYAGFTRICSTGSRTRTGRSTGGSSQAWTSTGSIIQPLQTKNASPLPARPRIRECLPHAGDPFPGVYPGLLCRKRTPACAESV